MVRLHLFTLQNGARSSRDPPLNGAVAHFLVFQDEWLLQKSPQWYGWTFTHSKMVLIPLEILPSMVRLPLFSSIKWCGSSENPLNGVAALEILSMVWLHLLTLPIVQLHFPFSMVQLSNLHPTTDRKTPHLLMLQNVHFFLGATIDLSPVWCCPFSFFLDACFVKAFSLVRLQISSP